MKVTRVYKHIRQISPELTFHVRIEYQWTLGKLNEKNIFVVLFVSHWKFAIYLVLISL